MGDVLAQAREEFSLAVSGGTCFTGIGEYRYGAVKFTNVVDVTSVDVDFLANANPNEALTTFRAIVPLTFASERSLNRKIFPKEIPCPSIVVSLCNGAWR